MSTWAAPSHRYERQRGRQTLPNEVVRRRCPRALTQLRAGSTMNVLTLTWDRRSRVPLT